VVHCFVLSALANLGCLQELSLKARDLVRDAERRHDRYALHVFQTGDAVMTHLALGEVDEALRVADESLHDYPPGQFTSQHRHHLVATVQSHLYLGDAEQAWARIERAWPSLRWSGFLLLDCLGTQLRYLKACAALAMARGPAASEAARFLRIARREARRIRRSTLSVAAPMADAIDAGIAGAKRRLDRQAVSLRAAAEGFARAEMALHREAARCHLADIAPGGDSGRTESYDWMTRQGIVHPASMARAVVPPA
jgi:hypothetical protein